MKIASLPSSEKWTERASREPLTRDITCSKKVTVIIPFNYVNKKKLEKT